MPLSPVIFYKQATQFLEHSLPSEVWWVNPGKPFWYQYHSSVGILMFSGPPSKDLGSQLEKYQQVRCEIHFSIFFTFTEYSNNCGNFESKYFPNTWSFGNTTNTLSPKCLMLIGLVSLGCKGTWFFRGMYPGFILNVLRKWDLYENERSPFFPQEIGSSEIWMYLFVLVLSFKWRFSQILIFCKILLSIDILANEAEPCDPTWQIFCLSH